MFYIQFLYIYLFISFFNMNEEHINRVFLNYVFIFLSFTTVSENKFKSFMGGLCLSDHLFSYKIEFQKSNYVILMPFCGIVICITFVTY